MFDLVLKANSIFVTYKHKKTNLEFDISSIVTARNLKDINVKNVFYVLNNFLNYKGEAFKDELSKRLEQSFSELFTTIGQNNVLTLPKQIVHRILDLFNIDEVVDFIKKSNIIKVPDRLKEEYDETIEINDQGSREQTFTIQDYIELVALITILKSTLGIIGTYANLYAGAINNKYKEYLLLDFYLDHPIAETKPFIKLKAYVRKLVDIAASSPDEFKKQIIEKGISENEMENYVLGIVIFQKLLVADEISDVNTKNIITKLYNAVKHRLKIKTNDTTSNIRLKSSGPTNVANDNESESVMESFRVPIDITIGFREEFNFIFSDPYNLAISLGVDDIDLVTKVLPSFRLLVDRDIPDVNIYLLSWIFKHVIDSRAIEYVNIDNIVNGLAAAFAFLYENDFKDIGLILSSFIVEDTDSFSMNTTVRNKLKPELKEELNKLFPYHKVSVTKNEVKHESQLDVINHYVNKISSYNLFTILDDELVNEITGSYNKHVRIESNIRDRIAEVIIFIERYGSKNLIKNLKSTT